MSTQQPNLPNQPASTDFRILVLEQRVTDVQKQFAEYERARESELKLQNVRDQVTQITLEVSNIKREQAEIRTQIVAADKDRIKADADQTASQLKLMNRVLYSFAGAVVAVLVGVAIFVLTHVAL